MTKLYYSLRVTKSLDLDMQMYKLFVTTYGWKSHIDVLCIFAGKMENLTLIIIDKFHINNIAFSLRVPC